jgi:hypothetical protein
MSKIDIKYLVYISLTAIFLTPMFAVSYTHFILLLMGERISVNHFAFLELFAYLFLAFHILYVIIYFWYLVFCNWLLIGVFKKSFKEFRRWLFLMNIPAMLILTYIIYGWDFGIYLGNLTSYTVLSYIFKFKEEDPLHNLENENL